MIIFVCLTWVASITIQGIIDEVEIQLTLIKDMSIQRIRKWRRIYFTTFDFIEEIDVFFGPVLLLIFMNSFALIVLYGSRFVKSLLGGLNDDPTKYITIVFANIFILSGFIIGSEVMKAKVT